MSQPQPNSQPLQEEDKKDILNPQSTAEKEPETEPITKYIKLEVAKQLQEMGYSKNVSEKACLYTNSNLDNALDWIAEHMNDPDFEKEERIIKQEGGAPKSTLTPEEAKAKAKELQEKMRKIHLQKQKELEEEQERNRIRTVKEMAKAKKLAEENETRLFIERQKREKQEAEIEKRKMLEQLARDKEERFGKKFDPFTQDAKKKEYTHEENVIYYLKTIKTLYPPFRAGQTLKNCYSTLKIVLLNILKNINEDKFKKVKMTNPNVQERIGKIPLAVKTLNELGFVENGEFLVVQNVDKDLFDKTIKYLEEEVKKLD